MQTLQRGQSQCQRHPSAGRARCRKKKRNRHLLMQVLEDRRVLATWSGPLAGDTTWSNTEIHEITGDVTVPSGVTLTIDPGAIVKFHSTSTDLFVNGTLDAQGTASQNIVFTSIRDDIGGDTNGDGGATAPVAGDWPRLQVNGLATIAHAHIRYGGHFHGSMVQANGGTLTMTDSLISDSASDGVRAIGADPVLTNNEYRDNLGGAISIDLNSNPTVTGVTVSGNGVNGLEVDPGTLANDLVWDNPDIVYWLHDDVLVPASTTLQIDAGQIVKLAHSGVELMVDGTLQVTGTSADPVIFTSFADDSRGGDTNGDGSTAVAVPGNWGRIHLRDASSGNSIEHFEAHFGGHFIGQSLLATNTDVSISNSTFAESATDGIRLEGTDAVMTDNTFTGNLDAAVNIDLSSNPTISGVTVSGNGINGLQVSAGTLGESLIWDDPDIVYHLDDDIVVPAGLALQIDAGQIVKPAHSGVELIVDGTLTVSGDAGSPVVFTSSADDTRGGDTNGDGGATAPGPGNWGRIRLNDNSTGNTISYLESYFGGHFVGDSLIAIDTDLSVSNSLFESSAADAIRLVGTDAILTDNTFTGNADAAVSMDLNSNPTFSGVTVSGNGINGLQVSAGTLGKSLVWNDPDIVYHLDDDIVVPAGLDLQIDAGQIVKPAHSNMELIVDGTLTVSGDAGSPVVFTSWADDTRGGDTNGDAGATLPAPGNWGRIRLNDGSTGNSIDYLESYFGGHFVGDSLIAINTDLTITNSSFVNSAADGVRLVGTDAVLTDNTFTDNADAAVSMDLNSNPAISGVTVSGNGINGLQVTAGTLGKNLIWDDPDIVYLLDDDVVVPAGISLQIDAGQIVKPAHVGVELIVDGTLAVTGDSANPVVFTSAADDTRGGDTNGDGISTAPSPGDWERIHLRDDSSGNTIDYLESYYGAHFFGDSLVAVNTDLSVSNSTFEMSAADAIRLIGTDAVMAGNVFLSNAGAAIRMDLNSNPQITGSSPVVAIGNGINGLKVDGGTLAKDLQWNDPDIVYWLSDDVVVPASRTLEVDDGQIIKFAHTGVEIIVDGSINVDATASAPAVLTSGSDDSIGGDTNGDADASVPLPGQWGQILLRAGSVNNRVDHARFRYGGHFVGSMVTADNAPLDISNSWLLDSAMSAVAARNGATVEMTSNIITGNAQSGIAAASGAQVTAVNQTISDNDRGVVSSGAGTAIELTNSLIAFHGTAGVVSEGGGDVTMAFNDVFNPGAANYTGIADPTGTSGNISADPLFVDASALDYSLDDGSPAVDAADGIAAPEFDFLGSARIDDPAVVNSGTGIPNFADLGALERDRWLSEIISPIRSGQIVAGDTLRLLASGNASPRPTQYEWAFGDGRTSSLEDPGLVSFTTVGTQTLTFRAIGADGTPDPDPDTMDVTVVAGGSPLPDLDVTSVELPDGLVLGQLNRVDYTVVNVGNAEIPGTSRTDAVYLSTDRFLDSHDRLLGSQTVSDAVAVGGGYSGTFHVAVDQQQLAAGVNYLIVAIDDAWQVLEHHQLNNEQALETAAAIPTLQSGVAMAGTFPESGIGHYYQIDVPAGKHLSVLLDDANDQGINEIYARFGALPTPGQYDARHGEIGADQQLVVPAAAPGTWFLLALGSQVPDDGDYAITATTGDIAILTTTPDRHGDSADAVMTITGAGFVGGTTVELVNNSGVPYAAAQTSIDSFSQITATFAAGTVPPGTYDVRVTASAATDTLADAFTVVAGGEAVLETNIVLPAALGYHQLATIFLEYANTGDVAMPAPVLYFTATQDGEQRGLMTLDQSRLTRGFWTSAQPEGFSDTIVVLTNGETPGVLQPGETGRIPIYWAGWQQPWDFSYPPFVFKVVPATADDSELIDWAATRDMAQVDIVSDDAWQAIWANLQNQVGTTYGDFVRMLSNNAAHLGRLGVEALGLEQLFGFEMWKADGHAPDPTLTEAIDGLAPAPGIDLTLARSFPLTISGRYREGAFGFGWSHLWEVELVEESDGTVRFVGPDGSRRTFQPDSRGGYLSWEGDHSKLTRSGIGFELANVDGTVISFDATGKVTSYEERNGNRITPGYVGGVLTTLTHSNGDSIQIEYNPGGRIQRITYPPQRETLFTYDAANEHLLSVTYDDGRVYQYEYDTSGGAATLHALTQLTLPDGHREFYSYDAAGRLTRVEGEGGENGISLSYSPDGTIISTEDNGAVVSVDFDHNGSIVQIAGAEDRATNFAYDGDLNPIRLTYADGRQTRFTFDDRGNILSATDALGHTSRLTYTRSTNLIASITDPLGSMTTYDRDGNGNLLAIERSGGTSDNYTYDAVGLTESWTNQRGDLIDYQLDSAGRLASQVFPDTSRIDYTYTTEGYIDTATNADGTIEFDYGGDHLIDRITYPGGRFLDFTYNLLEQPTALVDQLGNRVEYDYDDVGRLVAVSDGMGTDFVTYAYVNDLLSTETRNNGVTTTYTYSSTGRLQTLVNRDGSGTELSSFAYTYDGLGRPSSVTTSDGEWAYEYDGLSQLRRATFDATNPQIADQDIRYEYDELGNRVRTVTGGDEVTYETNDLNQVTRAGETTYQYDADGNLTREVSSAGTTNYAYDFLNRLVEVDGPGGTWTYSYDALGFLSTVTENGVTRQYVISPFGLGDVMGEYDVTGALVARFIQGDGLVGRVDPAGAVSYYTYDAAGNTAELVSPTGQVLNNYVYLPFGDLLSATVNVNDPFRFVGRSGVIDTGDGLCHTRRRAYDPGLGRFMQMDPIDVGGGDLNLYRYVHNSPTVYVDPSGLDFDYVAFRFQKFTVDPLRARIISRQNGLVGKYLLPGLDKLATPLTVFTTLRSAAKNDPLTSKKTEGQFVVELFADSTYSAVVLAGVKGLATYASGAGSAVASAAGAVAAPAVAIPFAAAVGYYGGYKLRQSFPSIDLYTQALWSSWDDATGGWLFNDFAPWADFWLGGGWWDHLKNKAAELIDGKPAQSKDPNEKTSLNGFGTSSFVAGGTTITYRIDFENDPSATAPAQIVMISDPLPDELDPATFELTEIGFGDVLIAVPDNTQLYQTVVPMIASSGQEIEVEIEAGIRQDTGEVFASFISLDPDTGLPPDVLTGFLPPEDDTGRGQGYFSFVIDHVPGLASGTEIRNVAEIVFDFSTSIATNQVDPLDPSQGTDPAKEALVTIDAGVPTSTVVALPEAFGTAEVTVDWSGQDDLNGSGIASYDIYVSQDDGPFQLALAGTTQTSHQFTGVSGSTYAFISVARDNVGHVEPMPAVADTETLVIIGAWNNDADQYDVDATGTPTALDALLIINELARRAVSDPDTAVLTPLPPGGYPPPYYDVNGDGKCTALDALQVINQMARINLGGGELLIESTARSVSASGSHDAIVALQSDHERRLDFGPEFRRWPPAPRLHPASSRDKNLATASRLFAIWELDEELTATINTLADDVARQGRTQV